MTMVKYVTDERGNLIYGPRATNERTQTLERLDLIA